ncbi:TRAP transporter small permease [Chloroflexota bacterium]
MKKCRIASIYNGIINYFAYLAGILVVFIMFTIGIEVVVRKLFGFSLAWAVEYSEHALLYITFLSTAWLLRNEHHIKIDVVLNYLSETGKTYLNIAVSIVGALLCLFTAYHAALTTWDVWQRDIFTSTTQEIPMAPLLAIICIGSLLLGIEFIIATYGHLKRQRISSVAAIEGRGNL